MRGIDRVLAGILLVGAVGGAAGFARQSGSDSSGLAVSLTAPPPQHIGAPGSVLFAHTPAPTRVSVDLHRRSRSRSRSRPRIVAAAPTRAETPKRAATRVTASAPMPKPTPAAVAPPERPRVLAAVPLTPVQLSAEATTTEPNAHGHAFGHVKQHGRSEPPAADVSAAPAAPEPAGQPQGHGGGPTKGRAMPDGD